MSEYWQRLKIIIGFIIDYFISLKNVTIFNLFRNVMEEDWLIVISDLKFGSFLDAKKVFLRIVIVTTYLLCLNSFKYK